MIFNKHDWTKISELYAETVEFKDPSLGLGIISQTRNKIIEKYSGMAEMFPDLHDEVVQIYPSRDLRIIVEFVSTGRTPDNSRFELPICTIFTIENEKIMKDFSYYDNFEDSDLS